MAKIIDITPFFKTKPKREISYVAHLIENDPEFQEDLKKIKAELAKAYQLIILRDNI